MYMYRFIYYILHIHAIERDEVAPLISCINEL